MSELLRAYRALLKAAWARALEYRAQAVLWLLTGFFPLLMLAVWLAVVEEVGPAAGWDRRAFIMYYVAAAVVYQLTNSITVWDWDEDIRTGNLSTKLLRPIDPFHQLATNELGWALFFIVVASPVLALALITVPELAYPLTPGRGLAFLLSLGAAFLLMMFMSSAFGMIAFWSTQARNLFSLFYGVGQFLSGWIAPLALFPEGIRNAAYLLPFRSVLSLPVEILMGRLDASGIAFGFAITAIWLLFFFGLYRGLWVWGLRRYEAVGA